MITLEGRIKLLNHLDSTLPKNAWAASQIQEFDNIIVDQIVTERYHRASYAMDWIPGHINPLTVILTNAPAKIQIKCHKNEKMENACIKGFTYIDSSLVLDIAYRDEDYCATIPPHARIHVFGSNPMDFVPYSTVDKENGIIPPYDEVKILHHCNPVDRSQFKNSICFRANDTLYIKFIADSNNG